MGRTEHVHIISAGERIHIAYPAVFRELPAITRTIVFTDSGIHEISSDPVTEKHRLAVRNAVVSAQEISLSLSIPFSREMIFPPAYGSVQSAPAKIRRQYPDARYTFDLTGGSKELCLSLLAFASWLGGEVSASFDEKTSRKVPLPDRSMRNMMENANYQTILAVLIRNRNAARGDSEKQWVARRYLFQQVWPYYTRSRTRSLKPGEPVIQYRKGRKPAQNMSQATFSSFIANLREAGLLKEGQDEKSRKEKAYRITDAGETAFRFFADPAVNTLVKSMIEGS